MAHVMCRRGEYSAFGASHCGVDIPDIGPQMFKLGNHEIL